MFKKLRNRIIAVTMGITTIVLIASGCIIMLSSSVTRPEPKIRFESVGEFNVQEFDVFIKNDREDGNIRLLITLICVGVAIEIAVFMIVYVASGKMIEPVQDSYDKQKMFIANASHELKTPLAVIQANMEALDVDEENMCWKDNIESEITHANKLVLDLLQLARMDAGGLAKNVSEEVDLKKEIMERIEIFKPKFAGKIKFKSEAKVKSWHLPKQDVLQVIDILLDNATKYGEEKIEISLGDEMIGILNDGAVIKKEDQKKVFDRFYQTDKTREGSGLGLAIAKALCEQNGWEIKCDGEKYTRFTLKLA